MYILQLQNISTLPLVVFVHPLHLPLPTWHLCPACPPFQLPLPPARCCNLITAVDNALFTEFALFEHNEGLKEQQRTGCTLSTWLNLNHLYLSAFLFCRRCNSLLQLVSVSSAAFSSIFSFAALIASTFAPGIFVTGCVCLCFCLFVSLSPPKPLDQSKNVT